MPNTFDNRAHRDGGPDTSDATSGHNATEQSEKHLLLLNTLRQHLPGHLLFPIHRFLEGGPSTPCAGRTMGDDDKAWLLRIWPQVPLALHACTSSSPTSAARSLSLPGARLEVSGPRRLSPCASCAQSRDSSAMRWRDAGGGPSSSPARSRVRASSAARRGRLAARGRPPTRPRPGVPHRASPRSPTRR